MNTYGNFFRVTTYGESHGKEMGCFVNGCPSNLKISADKIQYELNRRKPGQSLITTQRKEEDKVEILEGIINGKTTGETIVLRIFNKDVDMKNYKELKYKPRPGHADYTWYKKYGNWYAFDRAGGRETTSRVMAGAIAKKLLEKFGVGIIAYSVEIAGIKSDVDYKKIDLSKIEEYKKGIESNFVRCIDRKKSKDMEIAVLNAKAEGDSVGGIIETIATNISKLNNHDLEEELSYGLMSIPAVKGVEFGEGFNYAEMKGSQVNESLENILVARVAVKPTPSISKPQKTVNLKTMEETIIKIKGRHDPCIVPRAVPVVEAMVALTLVDCMLSEDHIPKRL